MADTELNMLLSVEDQISEGASAAAEELSAMAAGPYEGELSIAASVDDNASDALDTIATNADQAAEAMDQLTSNQVDAAAAMNESAAASADAGLGITDVGAGAAAADVSVRGATGGVRALTSVVKTVGKEAGMSTAAMGGLTTGSRLLTTGTRLLSGGLAAVGGALAAIPGWGWAAIAVTATLAASWKTNSLHMKDVAQQLKISIADLGTTWKNNFTQGGNAVAKFGQEHQKLGAPIRGAQAVYNAWVGNLNAGAATMSKQGAATNTLTAATERLRSANQNLKTTTDNLRTAQANYISAARGAEDANLRISTSVHSAEGAQIGLERATHNSGVAQQALAAMQASGTATADELWGAQMDVRDAALAVKTAQDTQTSSTTDQKRAVEDLPIATALAALAFGIFKQAINDQTTANNEARDSIANMQGVIDGLNGGGFASLASEGIANLQALQTEINNTVAAQSKIDPNLRQSPSLVDRVTTGVTDLMTQYKRLGDQAGVMPAVAHVAPIPQAAPAASQASQQIQVIVDGNRATSFLQDFIRVEVDGKVAAAIVNAKSRVTR